MSSTILLKNGTILSHDKDDEHVIVLRNTDLLIEGNRITQIGKNIEGHENSSTTTVIDCTDKIVSPGFTNTHAHLWQTQRKGVHADDTLLDYFSSGMIQLNHYTPEDVFWGQLAGAMESIDGGTTFVLDHAHICVNQENANQALSATITSGIRCLFAYSKPGFRLEKWTEDEMVPKNDKGPMDMAVEHIEQLAQNQPYGNGRLDIGFAFDYWFLPENVIKDTFSRVMNAGVKVITSHIVRGAMFHSLDSTIQLINSYNLLTTVPHLVLSHCTNLTTDDYALLSQTKTAISSTPETEAQMAHGDPPLFYPGLNTSLGVDCHTNNTSFMPSIARTGLFCARLLTNHNVLAQNKFPKTLRGSTEQAFNAMTIQGARAVGMGDRFGSLRVGKLADVIVFDTASFGMSCVAMTDPLVAVVRHSAVADVDTVVVDGVLRKRGGKICAVKREGVDGGVVGRDGEMGWDVVREKLLASTRDIWAKDEKCNRQLARDLVMKTYGTNVDNLVDVD